MKKISVFIVFSICSALLFSCASIKDKISLASVNDPATSTSKNPTDTGRGLEYTCSIQNGSILVSTQEDIAKSPEYKKDRAFIYKKAYKPVNITDYDTEQQNTALEGQLKYLEEVLIDNLVQATKEWKSGDSGSIKVTAEPQNDLPLNERSIRLTKMKKHPKYTVYDKDIFTNFTGSKLALGEAVQLDTGIKGKVVSIENDEVKVAFEPISDQPVEGPFGIITVKDMGDHFVTDIDARKGAIVRVGPAVGKIVDVNNKNFQIDYAHPFGGETLQCDVKVVAINREMQQQESYAHFEPNQSDKQAKTEATPSLDAQGSTDDTNKIHLVEAGDLVKIEYSAKLQSNGKLIYTTSSDIASDIRHEKIKDFKNPEAFGPITVAAGAQDAFPGLGYAVMGLTIGEQKEVVISADKAFGGRSPGLIRNFDRNKSVPTMVTMSAKEYSQKYDGFPVKGKKILYNPYVQARIVNVTEGGADLELAPVSDEMDSDFGLTQMKVVDHKINIHLTPKIGGYFELDKRPGRVVAVSDRTFTVDFNEPLAGQDILFDIKVLSLTKSDALDDMEIQWIEDYEKGMHAIEEFKKPAVLVLYADWCGYSKKLLNETLSDPRIKMMRDDYIWIKVDSDKHEEYKEYYEQSGFPLTVLLDKKGEVVQKISGFRPAGQYETEIKTGFINKAISKKLKKVVKKMEVENHINGKNARIIKN